MAKNTKTPVMILQELAIKRNTVPEYELIYSKQGTHDNIFHYQVTLLDEQAIGVGKSKKEAKHEAANKALELLAERGILHPNTSSELMAKVDIPMKAPSNCIPKLLDICVENNIPIAEFDEISAVGPPHCREFTYECRIAKIITRATAGSKKHAKQLAAKTMMDRIINILPKLQLEANEFMLTENDQEIIEKHTSLSKFTPGKINYNSKVMDFDQQFHNLMDNLNVNQSTVREILDATPNEDALEKLLELFDLKFKVTIMQEKPAIVCISINSDTPVTVIEMGFNIAEATSLALNKVFTIMEALLT